MGGEGAATVITARHDTTPLRARSFMLEVLGVRSGVTLIKSCAIVTKKVTNRAEWRTK